MIWGHPYSEKHPYLSHKKHVRGSNEIHIWKDAIRRAPLLGQKVQLDVEWFEKFARTRAVQRLNKLVAQKLVMTPPCHSLEAALWTRDLLTNITPPTVIQQCHGCIIGITSEAATAATVHRWLLVGWSTHQQLIKPPWIISEPSLLTINHYNHSWTSCNCYIDSGVSQVMGLPPNHPLLNMYNNKQTIFGGFLILRHLHIQHSTLWYLQQIRLDDR